MPSVALFERIFFHIFPGSGWPRQVDSSRNQGKRRGWFNFGGVFKRGWTTFYTIPRKNNSKTTSDLITTISKTYIEQTIFFDYKERDSIIQTMLQTWQASACAQGWRDSSNKVSWGRRLRHRRHLPTELDCAFDLRLLTGVCSSERVLWSHTSVCAKCDI